MTYEEVVTQPEFQAFCAQFGRGEFESEYSGNVELWYAMYVAAKAEAFERAANIAENWGNEDDEPTDPDVAFDCLAAAIRAEKKPMAESVSP